MTTLNSSKSIQTSLQSDDPTLITQLIKDTMTSAPFVALKAGSQYNACVNADDAIVACTLVHSYVHRCDG